MSTIEETHRRRRNCGPLAAAFIGAIAAMRIWGRALDPAAIAEAAKAG